jgi:hypothetical protein
VGHLPALAADLWILITAVAVLGGIASREPACLLVRGVPTL